MIRTIDLFGLMCKDNMLDRFVEVPEYVGKLLEDPHITVLVNAYLLASDDEPREVARDFLYALVARAFPVKATSQR